mmetsp:Transcript_4008/g.12504  ORF Transcript_4008/g.12504 Transcript_4008/m.12504 type:complete len:187 (-) Transcript_4008:243-803(-)
MHIQKTGSGQFTIHTLAHCSGVARQVCGGDQCCDKFFFAPQRNVSLYVLCDVDELNPHTGHFAWNRKYAPHGIVTLREPAKQVVSAFGFSNGHTASVHRPKGGAGLVAGQPDAVRALPATAELPDEDAPRLRVLSRGASAPGRRRARGGHPAHGLQIRRHDGRLRAHGSAVLYHVRRRPRGLPLPR